MTAPRLTGTPRVGLARAGALGLLAALAVAAPAPRAQPVTWEKMPSPLEIPTDSDRTLAVDFLYGEGSAASDPAADSLVIFHDGGVFLYNPSGAAGSAGDNGPYGPWQQLTRIGASDGLVTASGTFVMSNTAFVPCRGTGRGRDWLFGYDERAFLLLFESSLPALTGPAGVRALFTGTGSQGETARSLGDGAPGTWSRAGFGQGYPQSFGEVPPSAALPQGRILMGVWNGALYSDDGGMSYRPSNAFGQARYIVYSFAFLPVAGHPYGGTAFAGVHDIAFGGERAGAAVLRSDDGGATWTTAHRFTAAEMSLPVPANTDVTQVNVYASSDGALWAGVAQTTRASDPPRGGVMRSVDAGATWARADAGFRNGEGWGYAVSQLRASRTGVLYAATFRGVWRTTTAVVAAEASPAEASGGVAVSVRPNPAGGRVEVVVSLAEASAARVVVLDALGREVAVVHDGAAAAGERAVSVDTSSWPAGVYIVRATAGARVATTRLVVAR